MYRLLLVLLLVSLSAPAFCQKDTTEALVEGLYFTYQDFVNNSPSSFQYKPTLVYRSKKDSTIEGAVYRSNELESGTTLPQLWGFSDGHHVFICVMSGSAYQSFKILEYTGHYAYFHHAANNYIPIPLPGIAGSIAAANVLAFKGDKDTRLWYVGDNGRYTQATIPNLQRLFHKDTDLYWRFGRNDKIDEEWKKKFLVEFGKRHPW